MTEFAKRFDILGRTQLGSFFGILFSCFTGILFVGIPLQLAASKVAGAQLGFLSEFVGWLLFFGGGALLAAVGAWGGNLATPGYQPLRLRSIIAVSETAAVVVAVATVLVLSRSPIPTVSGESQSGSAQIVMFFVGVLVIALSASIPTWRFEQGLVKGLATVARLVVLGVLTILLLAAAVHLVFSLVPNL
jgi:hypothetical protein